MPSLSAERSKLAQVLRDKAKSGAYVKVWEVLVVAVIIVKLGFPRTEKSRLSLRVELLVIDVAANTASVYTFWAEEDSITWFMAVGLTIVLCVAACCQGLTTSLTTQAWTMPVLPQ